MLKDVSVKRHWTSYWTSFW